jgi:small subunit ribosomal protein S6
VNKYEAIFIVRPDLNKEALEGVISRVKSRLERYSANIEELRQWMKRKLAFSIKKFQEGIYLLGVFSADPKVIAELEKELRLDQDILRSLVVKVNK